MTDMNAGATVEAKQAFEQLVGQHNIKIQHYHANNGLFDTKAFRSSINRVNVVVVERHSA